jgi:ABC-type nitrate/sulfonate/bicarbonate transport system permease component
VGLVLPPAEYIKPGQAALVTAHNLAINQAGPHLEMVHALDNEREAVRPVISPVPTGSRRAITAMKVGVPFALIGAIVGEFMAATAGLGWKIQLYTAQFDTTGAVTGVFVLMMVVIAFNSVLNRLETHVLRWRPDASAGSGSEVQ